MWPTESGEGGRRGGHRGHGEDSIRLGRPSGRFGFFSKTEKEKAGTEVKSMDPGARTSGSESHLCHSLAT